MRFLVAAAFLAEAERLAADRDNGLVAASIPLLREARAQSSRYCWGMEHLSPPRRCLVRAIMMLSGMLLATAASALELGLPAQCTLGKNCFVQQYPDMDAGAGVADPYCGSATYDGHDGIDLRIMSMADVARGVPVLAMADGTVLRSRDGVPDHLVTSEADRADVADKECGNGMIVELGEGFEIQYCHLRQGSLVVKPGDHVERGQKLGEIGASGLAQFPHVHVTVRHDGTKIDPATGHALVGRMPQAGRKRAAAVFARTRSRFG